METALEWKHRLHLRSHLPGGIWARPLTPRLGEVTVCLCVSGRREPPSDVERDVRTVVQHCVANGGKAEADSRVLRGYGDGNSFEVEETA